MYDLKKIGEVFTSKFITGPSSYEKRIYWAPISQRLRSTVLHDVILNVFATDAVAGGKSF
jgi:hypothetical protein